MDDEDVSSSGLTKDSQELCVTGKQWQSFFIHAMNIILGPKEDRQLITGLHTVADVYCSDCGEELGWKYIKAYEETQKYKEGKCVLEKFKIIKGNG